MCVGAGILESARDRRSACGSVTSKGEGGGGSRGGVGCRARWP